MAEIPRELMTEILLYLPVKSLLRFRCASKYLRLLIDNVKFMNWHLNASCERKMIFQDRSRRFHVCDMNDSDSVSVQQHKQDHVFGYCNGLLLLGGNSPHAALWNPSTHQIWTLPCYPPCARIIGSGLGCDFAHDYKAVLMLYTQAGHVQVWVLKVRSNTWARLEDFTFEHKFVDGFIYKTSTGYFADGGLHWLACRFLKNSSQPEVLTFDLKKETFALVSLPVCSTRTDRVVTDLHVLDGSLCVSFFCTCVPLQADLYKREKDGGWTQVYCIKEPIILGIIRFENIRVLGYLKGTKKILLDFGMEDLVSYDVERKSLSKDETKKSPFWDNPILCVESLVFGGMEQTDKCIM